MSIHARKLFFLEIPEKLFYSFNFNFNVTNKEVNGLKLATIDELTSDMEKRKDDVHYYNLMEAVVDKLEIIQMNH